MLYIYLIHAGSVRIDKISILVVGVAILVSVDN